MPAFERTSRLTSSATISPRSPTDCTRAGRLWWSSGTQSRRSAILAFRRILEDAHARIEGTLDGRYFLFAIAVKTSTRSDRQFQPLIEANDKRVTAVVFLNIRYRHSINDPRVQV